MHIDPTPDQLSTFAARAAAEPDTPVTMLNLLAYREQADYSAHPNETPCSGREAYARYATKALDCVTNAGGRLVFAGAAGTTVIGPDAEQWDDLLLVEYPNAQALIDMLRSPEYQACVHHRSAALRDSRLVPLRAGDPKFQQA